MSDATNTSIGQDQPPRRPDTETMTLGDGRRLAGIEQDTQKMVRNVGQWAAATHKEVTTMHDRVAQMEGILLSLPDEPTMTPLMAYMAETVDCLRTILTTTRATHARVARIEAQLAKREP